ncbi:MAG TPA: M56 family metallopeptidase, partial [Phycisphaerae bacterium]|nr:M56 family metallopeptidase [Phycisphaerae bacterium]
MMQSIQFLWGPAWQRLALTLLHFLWQGLAVTVLAVAVVRLFRLRSGPPRYATYLLAMLVMASCPVVTFFLVEVPAPTDRPVAPQAIDVAMPLVQEGPPADALAMGERTEAEAMLPIMPVAVDSPGDGALPARMEPTEPSGVPPEAPRSALGRYLSAVLPWVAAAWLIGVCALSMRLLLGLAGTYRWRRRVDPLPGRLAEVVAALSERMGLAGFARVLASRVAVQPIVVGYLRPMVLLPAAMLTNLPPEMLEAVIAHELAHIRRLDMWVNLFQRVMETVLFYHPAVWWLSGRLRGERELCCDELAVAATGGRLTYASALERAYRGALRSTRPALSVGLGAAKRTTLARVRHVLGLAPSPTRSRWWLAGALGLLSILMVVIGMGVSSAADGGPAAGGTDAATTPPATTRPSSSQAPPGERGRTAGDMERRWRVLADADPRKAFTAVLELEQAGDRAAAFLATKLEPVAAADAKQIAGLIAHLGAPEFATRQRASEALSLIGISIEEALHEALRATKDPEVRSRLNELIASAYSPVPTMAPAWRRLRAIRALERIGTPQARALLGALAAGAADARATQQAAAALRRLGRGDGTNSPTWWLARAEEEAELWGIQDEPAHSFARIAKVLADAGHIEAALALTRRADDATAQREATYRIAAAYARAGDLKAANRLATLVSYPVGHAEVRCRIGVALARTGRVEPAVPPQSSADWIAATAGHPPANWPRRSPSKWQVPEGTLKSVRARIHAAIAVAHATAGRREAYRKHIKQAESLANGIPGDINRMDDLSGPAVAAVGRDSSEMRDLFCKSSALEAALLARGAVGDHDGAQKLLTSIPAGAHRDGIARSLVKVLAEAGAWKPAGAVLELIAYRDEAYLWMLAARARAGDLDEARALYRRISEREGTHRLVGRMHLAAGGDRAGKAADYEQVLRDAARLSWLPAATYRRLARIQAGTRPRADILNWIRALPKPRLRYYAFLGAAEGLCALPDRRAHAAASPSPNGASPNGASTQPGGKESVEERLQRLWVGLGSADPKEADQAVKAMVALGDPAVAFLAGRLYPAPADAGHVKALIAKLDDAKYAVRKKAGDELMQLERAATPLLKEAVKNPELALEASTRIRQIVDYWTRPPLGTAQARRFGGAAEVLARIGTDRGTKVLARLAAEKWLPWVFVFPPARNVRPEVGDAGPL